MMEATAYLPTYRPTTGYLLLTTYYWVLGTDVLPVSAMSSHETIETSQKRPSLAC